MRTFLTLVLAAALFATPACKSNREGVGVAIDLAPGEHAIATASGGGKLRCRNLGPGDAEIAWTTDPDADPETLTWELLQVFTVKERRVRGGLSVRARALESTTSVGFGGDPGTSVHPRKLAE